MKKKDLVVVNRLIRNAVYGKKESYQHYCNITFEGETYKAFTNGFMILASAGETFGYTETLDFAKGIQSYMSIFEKDNENHFAELQLDKEEILARKKVNKEYHSKSPYDLHLGYGLNPDYNPELHIGLNCNFILDCMSFFNTDRCFIEKDGFNKCGVYTHPVYFRNDTEKKIGCLCPVNLSGTYPEKYNHEIKNNSIAA